MCLGGRKKKLKPSWQSKLTLKVRFWHFKETFGPIMPNYTIKQGLFHSYTLSPFMVGKECLEGEKIKPSWQSKLTLNVRFWHFKETFGPIMPNYTIKQGLFHSYTLSPFMVGKQCVLELRRKN